MPEQYRGPDIEDLKPNLQRGDDYLLVIAIDEYKYCPKLSNCVKDAQGFISVMKEQYKLSKDRTYTLLNEEATRSNIILALKELRTKIGKKDSLLLYFSGHGEVEDDQGYWVPVDGKPNEEWDYISSTQIKTQLNAIDSFHTLVIADACFAGSFFISYKATQLQLSNRRSRLGISASHSRERALDGNPGENSPFATELLRILKHNQDALPVDKLFTMVRDGVARRTKGKQTPIFKHLDLKGDDQGQYVFLPTTNETIAWAKATATNSIPAYLEFSSNFPKGEHIKEAQAAITLLEDELHWQEAQERRTISAYLEYQKRHPNGLFVGKSNEVIQQLNNKSAFTYGASHSDDDAIPTPPIKEKNVPTIPDKFKKLMIPGAVLLGILIISLLWLLPRQNVKKRLKKEIATLTLKVDAAMQAQNRLAVERTRAEFLNLGIDTTNSLISKKLTRIDQWLDSLDKAGGSIYENATVILPELIEVKKGSFLMGCENKSKNGTICYADEKPAHQITVSAFYIGKFEVTNNQFAAFLNDRGVEIVRKNKWYNLAHPNAQINVVDNSFEVKEDYEDYPVALVNWDGALAYCDWLNESIPGSSYRLPTEAEWEYAARGGHKDNEKKIHFYAGSSNIDEVAWCNVNSQGKSHPVGQKQPNELGAYDMSGNVQEWCQDWFIDNYYKDSPKLNPKGPKTGGEKVIRGGAWPFPAAAARAVARHKGKQSTRDIETGFRIVKDAR